MDRLRVLLDRPLEPRVARAVLALAGCVTVGFGIVVALSGIGGVPADSHTATTTAAHRPSAPPPSVDPAPREAPPSAEPASPPPVDGRQDPQDRRGTPAFHRAKQELRGHRALQHLPYRTGRVAITLVGADHGRAVLAVRAASVQKAKKGWRAFLRRFRDSGLAYEPRFEAKPTRGGR